MAHLSVSDREVETIDALYARIKEPAFTKERWNEWCLDHVRRWLDGTQPIPDALLSHWTTWCTIDVA